MPKYLSATTISAAVQRLIDSRALGGFVDFLVLKRALVKTGSDAIELSMKNSNFTGAMNELAATRPHTTAGTTTAEVPPFVKVFGKADYLSAKYPSNGAADTLAGSNWRSIVRVFGKRPRSASLENGHDEHLASNLIKAGLLLPTLEDASIWYHRATDIEEIAGTSSDMATICKRLCEKFVNDLGLTSGELNALFQPVTGNLTGFEIADVLQDTPADPIDYLPKVQMRAELLENETLSSSSALTVKNDNLSRALLTKPFLILTGPSGTGKTRGAVELAKQVCGIEAHRLVAVGADWTDNRHVLGYLNPLETVTEEGELFPIYETTPILDLILHADANRDEPHVLILDEMNLSHVERYFADFLSAMELKDKTDALKLHSAGIARSRTGAEIRGSIDFPSNLFVIGTVNIDETTYMFSPKVLDRANVIEIHAGETEMGDFLKDIETARPEEAAKDYGIAFLDAARVIQGEGENAQVPALPTAVRDAAAEHLMALFKIMARGRAEYGFRTGKEVKAFLRTAHFLAGPEPAARATWAGADGDWLKALDAQILQKILPKLHGSRTRLAPLLGALATYCATGTEEYAMEHFPENGAIPKRSLKDATGNKNAKFPESYRKLERMIEVLVEEQFVSFIC